MGVGLTGPMRESTPCTEESSGPASLGADMRASKYRSGSCMELLGSREFPKTTGIVSALTLG